VWCCLLLVAFSPAVFGEEQPLQHQRRRIATQLQQLGVPLAPGETLDSRTLFQVQINPEQRVKVGRGPATALLLQKGWSIFLVRVENAAGTTATLRASSPQALPVVQKRWDPSPDPQPVLSAEDLADRWLDLAPWGDWQLQGLPLEYRVLQLYSRDRGRRAATLEFDVGQGTQDLGFRAECDLVFDCRPARSIVLEVRDERGPCMASFRVRDARGFVYPPKTKRLAPDFFFHSQIYRQSGETLQLADGDYEVEVRHGPEYLPQTHPLQVQGDGKLSLELKRWIDPAAYGYLSSDPHIHAAGCSHYSDPTEGVTPDDMWRHVLGEDLKMAASLNWGPCFYFQNQFQDQARVSERAQLHHDVEVSGFGSHKAGHLILLGLKQQKQRLEDWPTLALNTLRWAKKQGAVTGFPHSGWGLEVPGKELPNHVVPEFNGIGACEFIVDVTHKVPGPDGKLVPAVDFVSAADTPYPWELNVWYHTLNAGFRTALSGETDFPCIMEERVGQGRVYVRSRPEYGDWLRNLQAGNAYVGDGKSHILNFRVRAGVAEADVAALLEPAPARVGKITEAPYWDIQKARVGSHVPLEVVVNGRAVHRQLLPGDGKLRHVRVPLRLAQTSWVAMRILPSCHTNAVWTGTAPFQPVPESVRWCLAGVERCWRSKKAFYAPAEMADARAAYEHARRTYRALLPKQAKAQRLWKGR
jgi:hypothetical protein